MCKKKRTEALGAVVEDFHLLVVALKVDREVAPLPGLIWALGTLKRGWLTPALDHLVSPHGALPPVALAAESAAELAQLLMGYAHVDDAEVGTWLGQDLERVREHDLPRRAF
jgi:hypothetical protein